MKNAQITPTIGRALWPLITIPIVIIVDIILVFIGYMIDSAIYNPPADTASFMVPAFTVISMIIAAIISFIALIVMIVLIAIRISKYNKSKNALHG
ncbi:MAG: hypothetical protein K5921_00600 [Lachnospiraceae bacterium]|nr:hypothetical protein [Lachnospiraceae bacterium]